MPQVMNGDDIRRAVRRIAHEILERHRGADRVVIVGVLTRGAHLARLLADSIAEFEGVSVPVGELDVGDYRDDRQLRPPPTDRRTAIPTDISERSVIVVDDVLYTGRTVRAALDALSDIGRAEQTELAVLVEDPGLRAARMVLARAVQIVLRNGLTLLGIGAPRRMERPEQVDNG